MQEFTPQTTLEHTSSLQTSRSAQELERCCAPGQAGELRAQARAQAGKIGSRLIQKAKGKLLQSPSIELGSQDAPRSKERGSKV